MTEQLEGWHTDPFGRHEARWLSDGQPTKLVRDGGVESYDAPPDGEVPTVVPTPIEASGQADGDDLRRADGAQAEGQYDPKKARQEIRDLFAQIPWQTR